MSHRHPVSQDPASGGFAINTEAPAISKRVRRKKTPFWRSPLMIILLILAGLGGGLGYVAMQQNAISGMQLATIEPQTIEELSELSFTIPFSDPAVKPTDVQFSLVNAPQGARIDHETGMFHWTPSEKQGPMEVELGIEARPLINPANVSRQQFTITVTENYSIPEIEYIDPQTIRAQLLTSIPLNVIDPDIPEQSYLFEVVGEAPTGLEIDPEFGVITWTPPSEAMNESFDIQVKVSKIDHPELSNERTIQITVKDYDPIEKLQKQLAERRIDLEETGRKPDGQFEADGRIMLASMERNFIHTRDRLEVYTYNSKSAADREAESIAPDLSRFLSRSDPFTAPTKVYRDDRVILVASGASGYLHGQLNQILGEPIAVTKNFDAEMLAARSSDTTPEPEMKEPPKTDESSIDPLGDQGLEEHYTDKNLFNKRKYEEIRKIYANRFALKYKDSIEAAFAEDLIAVNEWFEEHPEIREELFTAIQPEFDSPVEALRVFHKLWKENTEQVEKYSELAIATSVVWDIPQRGVYDYSRHQQRTHSNMPDELLETPISNFQYLIDHSSAMEGRLDLVPWEFLVHLVNHKTPTAERTWALQNYLPKRQMFGSCYADVPYDTVMLETQSQQCKLDGADYSLSNLRSLGGVCAMQADFAARVGKSIGVPAEYVRGESAFGDYHAWVMWVELKRLTKTGIEFSLESHGRYRGDKYYVGQLQDPHTGTWITDRDLELRLHTVGLDPIAKRLSDHAMTTYPYLKNKRKFSLDDQLDYLQEVIELSPGNIAAWSEIAELAGSGNLDRKHERLMRRTLDKLFATFVNFPDFTWKIFDNLIQYEEETKDQIELYERLIQLYVAAGRPDLASEARLMMTGYLVDENRQLDAIEGLAATIMAFPEEGRYVPKMLDRLEVLVNTNPSYSRHLITFYRAFLPKVPPRRGDSPSKYCMKMYERGIMRFEQADAIPDANKYKALLAELKGS